MFLAPTKTLFVEALKSVFTRNFPDPRFRDIWVGMDFPIEETSYPGIWVDFNPTSALQAAGIGHQEYIVGEDGIERLGTRWRFGGNVEMTVGAMTSLERDDLADALVEMIAFGSESPRLSAFRRMLEVNDLMNISMQWDQFSLIGKAETPGTPWGTADYVYEITLTMDCQGSFVSDPAEGKRFVPLSQVIVKEYAEGEPVPQFETSPPDRTANPWV